MKEGRNKKMSHPQYCHHFVVGYLHPIGTSSLGLFLGPRQTRNIPKYDFYRSRFNSTWYVKETNECTLFTMVVLA